MTEQTEERFEDIIERLDALVQRLESGGLSPTTL